MQKIMMYFVRWDIVPFSRYFFAPAANNLLLISQLYSLGEDLAKAHKAIKIKTVVG